MKDNSKEIGNLSLFKKGMIIATATMTTFAAMSANKAIFAADSENTETKPVLQYNAHVENIGWQGSKIGDILEGNSQIVSTVTVGTVGRSLRMEALTISLTGVPGASLKYNVHSENKGWTGWKENGEVAGTVGESLRAEALKISVTGLNEAGYSLYYRVHVSDIGWMNWISADDSLNLTNYAGTTGQSLRMEAIEIVLVKVGVQIQKEEAILKLTDYKNALALNTVDTTTQNKIETAIEDIEKAESESEVAKILEEIVDEIVQNYPTIDEWVEEVAKNTKTAQEAALEMLQTYKNVAPSVKELTNDDLNLIDTIISEATSSVNNARTPAEVTNAVNGFNTLMGTYTTLINKVNTVNALVAAQNELINELNTYREALKEAKDIDDTEKEIIKRTIDMYEEEIENAETAAEITTATTGIKARFDNYINQYTSLKKIANDNLLNQKVESAIKELTTYLTYTDEAYATTVPNTDTVDDTTDYYTIAELAQKNIDTIKNTAKQSGTTVNDIEDLLRIKDAQGTITGGYIKVLEDFLTTAKTNIKTNKDLYVKEYKDAIEELDEYSSNAAKVLSGSKLENVNKLIQDTKTVIGKVSTHTEVQKYMALFRNTIAEYSNELDDYALERTIEDAIATLKEYEKDTDTNISTPAKTLRMQLETGKDTNGDDYTTNSVKAALKACEDSINAYKNSQELAAIKADAINEFSSYLDTVKDTNALTVISDAITAINNDSSTDKADLNSVIQEQRVKVNEALAKAGEAVQSVLTTAKLNATKTIDNYIDIAEKTAGIDSNIITNLRDYKTLINKATTTSRIDEINRKVANYINNDTTVIKAKLDAITALGATDLSTIDATLIITGTNATPELEAEYNKQVENIKKVAEKDIATALTTAQDAIKDIATNIKSLKDDKIAAAAELLSLADTSATPNVSNVTGDLRTIYDRYLKKINDVTIDEYKVNKDILKADTTNADNRDSCQILKDAEAAIKNYRLVVAKVQAKADLATAIASVADATTKNELKEKYEKLIDAVTVDTYTTTIFDNTVTVTSNPSTDSILAQAKAEVAAL